MACSGVCLQLGRGLVHMIIAHVNGDHYAHVYFVTFAFYFTGTKVTDMRISSPVWYCHDSQCWDCSESQHTWTPRQTEVVSLSRLVTSRAEHIACRSTQLILLEGWGLGPLLSANRDCLCVCRYEVDSRKDPSRWIVCGQGPPPPNPMVVERFQQVISQLFQQVLLSMRPAIWEN